MILFKPKRIKCRIISIQIFNYFPMIKEILLTLINISSLTLINNINYLFSKFQNITIYSPINTNHHKI